MTITTPVKHPFIRSPNATLLTLSLPVLLSLIAEPVTGLVDTAFVARLGSHSLAALGVGTSVLSSVFWIFNFLGIGAQTEVAQSTGQQNTARASQLVGLALLLAISFGLLLLAAGVLLAPQTANLMGADAEVQIQAVTYIRWRLTGAPAVLVTLAAFGALRGLQDMRTPLKVAILVNGLNIVLDAALIFGLGPFPALGITGAAIASSISQWVGAFWSLVSVKNRLGFPHKLYLRDFRKLMQIGGDLFSRTGLLTIFVLLATRAATRIGPDAGAAHQAIRQFWVFAALLMDAFAVSGQSLVAFFMGSGWKAQARRVAFFVCAWCFGAGIGLTVFMLVCSQLVATLLVPPTAVNVFFSAWVLAAVAQPLNALSFGTDGIHWGTGDYRFLRNAMLLATTLGTAAIFLINESRPDALNWVWVITGGWICMRATLGIIRIWPGIGKSPLRVTS